MYATNSEHISIFCIKIYSVLYSTRYMTTSVKIDDDTQSRIERLQAEIRLETGT